MAYFHAERSFWIKWRFPLLIVVGVAVGLVVLYMSRGALLPLILAIIAAELLFPLVAYVERYLPLRERHPRIARLVSIGLVYVGVLVIFAALVYLTFQPIIQEVQDFIETAPEFFEDATETVEGWLDAYEDRVPADARAQVEELLGQAGGLLGDAALSMLSSVLSAATSTISIILGIVVVPFILFYLLKDKEEILEGIYSAIGEPAAYHTRNVLGLVHRVVGSYVRAQALSALIVGVSVFLGLWAMDIKFAVTLGLIAGLAGLVPIIGAILGAVPGLLVALATDPTKLIWVLLLYIIVQFVESNIISPRIQSGAVRLHPVVIITTLVVASAVLGLWGMLVAIPLVAVARDVFVYFHSQWRGQGAEPVEDSAIDLACADNTQET